jgi:predicted small lipoprotein YifL
MNKPLTVRTSTGARGICVLTLLLVALAIAGCGKKNPPQAPPGVPNTYPRAYPSA